MSPAKGAPSSPGDPRIHLVYYYTDQAPPRGEELATGPYDSYELLESSPLKLLYRFGNDDGEFSLAYELEVKGRRATITTTWRKGKQGWEFNGEQRRLGLLPPEILRLIKDA